MSENSLPKEYKGFSTAELLAIWKNIPNNTIYDPETPVEKMIAMNGLFYEYALLDFGNDEPAKIRRSKQLMAPYGIDPAPWADENGVGQEHLRVANRERLRQEEIARHERLKAIRGKDYDPDDYY